MSLLVPVAIIGGAIFLAVTFSEQTLVKHSRKDTGFHPTSYQARPPPAPLRDRLLQPDWGQKRYQVVKSVQDTGGLTMNIFQDPVTGQPRLMQQNDGFQSS